MDDNKEYLELNYNDYLFRLSEQLYTLSFDIWEYRYTTDDKRKRELIQLAVSQLYLIRDELEKYRDEHR